MSCEALISIEKPCDSNTGGIRTVWICQQENVTTATPAWEITSLVLTDPANVYAINRNTGNYTEETAQDLLTLLKRDSIVHGLEQFFSIVNHPLLV